MKRQTIFFCGLFFLLSQFAYCQITYDSGYYIDNLGTRHAGLIKNRGWNNNPRQFEFKTDATAAEVLKTIDEVKEFGVDGDAKYVRTDVDLDRSTGNVEHLSDVKAPKFANERLFVKVLVEGNENLYVYNESGLTRYFFKDDTGNIKQLVYKKYAINASQVGENTQFRNQIWNEVRCEKTDMKTVENLRYSEQDLIKHFRAVNNCDGKSPVEEVEASPKKKGSFNLKASIGYSKMNFSHDHQFDDLDFSKSGITYGFEFEYILPTNRNKWGIVIEPTYNSFSGSKYNPFFGEPYENRKLTYNFIETTLGVRHFMFLHPESKFFITLSLSTNIALEAELQPYAVSQFVYKLGAGIGYQYKRLAAEIKFFRPHGLLEESNLESKFSKTSLMLRYIILQ